MPHRNQIYGQKVPITHTYQPGEDYGIQYQDCRRIIAEWTSWSPWSACTVSCGGGSTTRSRVCKRPDGSETSETDCVCNGESSQTKSCANDCCPTWHIELNGQWTPQRNQSAVFSQCPKCGDGDQISVRLCQCDNNETIVLGTNGECSPAPDEVIQG